MKVKKFYLYLLLLIVTPLINNLFAQSTTDTVYIPGAQSLQISDIINADTAVSAHRVYVLDRGAIYYIEKAFEINHPCTFIAKGDPTKRPPVLAPAIRADGSSEEWFFKLIKQGIKVELNDLYLLSMRADGKTLGWSRGIHIGADNISLKLRRVVFDGFTEAGIRVDGADFVKLDVQDCHFRNMLHSTAYFGGQPFLSGGLDQPDTIKFINNTFFACNSYIFSIRGYDPYSLFEHNTMVYGAVNPFLTRQASNLYMRNNLMYAMHAWGGDPEQIMGGWFFNWPDTVSSSIYQIRRTGTYQGRSVVGPEAFVEPAKGIDSSFFVPSKRVHITVNNVYHFPEKLVKFYNDWNDTVKIADSVEIPSGGKRLFVRKITLARWINDYGKDALDSLTNPKSWDYSPNIACTNNIDANPNFTDAGVLGHLDQLIDYVRKIASRKLDNPWHYELNFPPKWPIPEKLVYSNSALMTFGTDGYPVGDLNWFPEKKQLWLTGIKEIDHTIPTDFSISDAYPNPFNPETKINFSIAKQAKVRLTIYNILGQKVRTLINQEMMPGKYAASWDGRDDLGRQVSSGVYLIGFESDSFKAFRKVVLMK
ncbi:T9SS type A sorting domain-containing protein [Rosettibacter firmus]|uniref:T9SS type A sorting domain-containing protein n=1 Tax=Rosettibacter firmus TaxID=3111522 RepID=UPI00336C1C7C